MKRRLNIKTHQALNFKMSRLFRESDLEALQDLCNDLRKDLAVLDRMEAILQESKSRKLDVAVNADDHDLYIEVPDYIEGRFNEEKIILPESLVKRPLDQFPKKSYTHV